MTGWKRLNRHFSKDAFSLDDTEVIFVTRDDGEIAPVLRVLSNVIAMWEDELARVSPQRRYDITTNLFAAICATSFMLH